ncbi:MAG: tetraacyldisaccharide 4'-kinase [Sphingobacteriales bacterium]|nr:MAG: tetraacyldisaccharide 4'-kinase [Sphingobacteriales bacterium]
MQIIRYILFPFSLLYGFITWVRNKLYDFGILKSHTFDIPVLSVGNLEVGGSGKTPATEYLVKLLEPKFSLATLSRGYGRITSGFRWVDASDNASLCGDEPLQIILNYPNIGVAVCEDRVRGVNRIKDTHDLVILDDAYQHRGIKPGLSILLFDFNRLNHPQFILPTGNYREFFGGRKRADILVVTKCPTTLTDANKQLIIKKLKPFNHQKVIFSFIAYADDLQPLTKGIDIILASNITQKTAVLLLTGIAKPQPLLDKIREKTQNITHHNYPDHHNFTSKNILKLVNNFKAIKAEHKIIITTQKDAIRLKDATFEQQLNNLPIYYWQIGMAFADDDRLTFEETVANYVNKY